MVNGRDRGRKRETRKGENGEEGRRKKKERLQMEKGAQEERLLRDSP